MCGRDLVQNDRTDRLCRFFRNRGRLGNASLQYLCREGLSENESAFCDTGSLVLFKRKANAVQKRSKGIWEGVAEEDQTALYRFSKRYEHTGIRQFFAVCMLFLKFSESLYLLHYFHTISMFLEAIFLIHFSKHD